MEILDNIRGIPQSTKEFFTKIIDKFKIAKGKKFVFLLIGKTGVGKSSTVNALLGKDIAPVGDFEATTMKVEEFDAEMGDINFTVIDTPGLCDDLTEKENDKKYLDLIRKKIKQVDSMWYVTRLDETRVTADEKKAIKLITDALGKKVWNYSVLVFNFSNKVEQEDFQRYFSKRTELLKNEISLYAGNEIANAIPAIAIDTKRETIPDGTKWLGELYTKVLTRVSEQGLIPFLLATANDVMPLSTKHTENKIIEKGNNNQPRIEINDNQKEEIKKRISKEIDASIIIGGAGIGASIGSFLGPVGIAIGGSVGAAIGLIAWLWD